MTGTWRDIPAARAAWACSQDPKDVTDAERECTRSEKLGALRDPVVAHWAWHYVTTMPDLYCAPGVFSFLLKDAEGDPTKEKKLPAVIKHPDCPRHIQAIYNA